MDTDATEDQRALLDVSTRFMEEVCPLELLREPDRLDTDFSDAYRQQAAELGWFSMLVPEELGGGSLSDNGMLDAALIAYVRGAHLQPGSFVGSNVVAHALAAAGTDELRAEVLPALVGGEVLASWAVATTGERALDGGVSATRQSDGGLKLTGTKTAVPDVGAGSWLLVTARSEDGPTQALVRVDAPGVTVTELDSLDLTRTFSQVGLEQVVVPASQVVGTPASNAALLDEQLAIAATLTAAESVGAMHYELELTVQYAKDRIAFGRPIGSFQAIKHLLADASLSVEMSKAIVLAAAKTIGTGDDHGTQAASMAKAFVGDAAIELAQNCFQVFGGIGYTWEHDQHYYLRRLTSDAGLYGDAAWHREHLCQLAGI
jgi:alkylation response protein AidB-like acyl-CoA dehydrogenase